MDSGNFLQAIDSLEAAYGLLKEPGIQRRLGDLYERVDQPQNAIKAYTLYLELRPDASDAPRIQAQIKTLQQARLGTLHILSTPDGATVALAPRGEAPGPKGTTPLHLEQLAPGTYDLTLTAPGHQTRRHTVKLAPGGDINVVLDLVPEPDVSTSSPASAPPARAGAPTMAWVLGGLGVTSALVAGGSLWWARSLGGELDEMEGVENPTGRPAEYDDTLSRHNTLQITGLAAGGVALLSLAGAAFFWMSTEEEPEASGFTLHVSPSSTTATWTLAF